jgi:hypothetical protein
MGGGSTAVKFLPKKGKPLEGVINFYASLCTENPHKEGKITVTASSTGPRCVTKPEQVLVPHSGGEWTSANEPESWFQVHFAECSIELAAYTIQTFPGRTGTTHLKSWKLEGSKDGFGWIEVDSVPPCEDLNSPNAIITRNIAKGTGFYKDFKLTQLTANHFGTQCLTLDRIEFFGQLHYDVLATGK